jgi:hypothetical protein
MTKNGILSSPRPTVCKKYTKKFVSLVWFVVKILQIIANLLTMAWAQGFPTG